MGDAKNRDRRLGRSYLDRIAAAREREIANSNRLARERKAYAAEVQAQAKRIGMALGTTNMMAEIPVVGAPDADGVPVPTGRKELHPARIVLVGLDALLERLAMMERAVDGACPAGGKDPACPCVACKVRTASGMLFRVEAAASEAGGGGAAPFLEPDAQVPAASAVVATPDEVL